MSIAAGFLNWIGRSWERTDVIGERLVNEFLATFSPHLLPGPPVPLGLFWCLCPDIVTADKLGDDGHPRLGIFMPAIPLSRRMWAGGDLDCQGEFAVGDKVTKRSTITDITSKNGKTGELCFVTISNEYVARGELVVRERQNIVYRPAPAAPMAMPGPATATELPASWTVEATPTLLFRYSAITNNGHRIHYDHPYATGVEGYPGLVVHGPLQATIMLNRAAVHFGRCPRTFVYRSLAPLIAGAPFSVVLEQGEGSGCTLKTVRQDGTVTLSGEAT